MFKKKDNEEMLSSYVYTKFNHSMSDKELLVNEWETYMKAYENENWENVAKPDYKSDVLTNYIFGTIETIRPIMLDNNPKFLVLPRVPEARDKSLNLERALSYEYDREKVSTKLSSQLITMLVYGTAIFYIGWDGKNKEVLCEPINPLNIFPDPLATSVDDCEYIIYAKYMNVNTLKNLFPDKADKLYGSDVNYSELVNDNDRTASQINNQVLVCEMWTRDTIDIESDDDEIPKIYPNGRVIVCCPELSVILSDKENPYKDGKLPFIIMKDYDVPFKFWGEGEVKRLLSAQQNMNELNACIIDNAKATANMPWIIDKNSGIGMNKLTNRPGLVIRKNPQTEVRREQAPNMPVYVSNKVMEFKEDIEQISGVYDTIKGNNEKGVYTAQGILALQEAGQSRIRLKVKNLESSIGDMANLWFNRMKQFWKDERWIRYVKADGKSEFAKIDKESFKYPYDLSVASGSTMMINKGAMLDLMIRLAQTPAEDGLPMVDREAVLNYIPQVDAKEVMKRLDKMRKEQQQQQLSDQEHMKMHEEGKATDQEIGKIIQDLVKEVQTINKELTNLQIKLDEEDDAARMEKLKEEAFNEGYGFAEDDLQANAQPINPDMEEQGFGPDIQGEELQDTTNGNAIPPEVLNEIQQLTDEELLQLLELYPSLKDEIMAELNNTTTLDEKQKVVEEQSDLEANNFGTPIPME